MPGMIDQPLPRPVTLLGLAGIVPQLLCLIVVLALPDWRWVALAAACFYAALILSFLGGMWWMLALLRGERAWEPYLLAVVPSLGGWAALLPWTLVWTWPGPALALLGCALLASPLVDRRLGRHLALPEGWLRLRVTMASGLGLATLALGLLLS